MGNKMAAAAKKGNKHTSKRYKLYEISGNSLKRKNKFCPKCGNGFFMAAHKDRTTCGNCGFTEFKK
jgi:small subunit ribosomal protein S27Ae